MTEQKKERPDGGNRTGRKGNISKTVYPKFGENTSAQNKIPYESRHGYCCLRNGKRGKSND